MSADEVVSRGIHRQVEDAIAPIFHGLVGLCCDEGDRAKIPDLFENIVTDVVANLKRQYDASRSEERRIGFRVR